MKFVASVVVQYLLLCLIHADQDLRQSDGSISQGEAVSNSKRSNQSETITKIILEHSISDKVIRVSMNEIYKHFSDVVPKKM